MSHMTCHDVLLAYGHLMRVIFHFRVHVGNCWVHILSLDTIGHGMRWHVITKNSFMFSCDSYWHVTKSIMLHVKIQVTLNSNVLQIENKLNKITDIVLLVTLDVLDIF